MRLDVVNTSQLEELESFGFDYYMIYPSVDQIIDFLRKKYNIVIYNKIEPFVDPKTHNIVFRFAVKWCNMRDGWNGRQYIGETELTSDIYYAKRQAIDIAIKYLKERQQSPGI